MFVASSSPLRTNRTHQVWGECPSHLHYFLLSIPYCSVQHFMDVEIAAARLYSCQWFSSVSITQIVWSYWAASRCKCNVWKSCLFTATPKKGSNALGVKVVKNLFSGSTCRQRSASTSEPTGNLAWGGCTVAMVTHSLIYLVQWCRTVDLIKVS